MGGQLQAIGRVFEMSLVEVGQPQVQVRLGEVMLELDRAQQAALRFRILRALPQQHSAASQFRGRYCIRSGRAGIRHSRGGCRTLAPTPEYVAQTHGTRSRFSQRD